jgi:transposase
LEPHAAWLLDLTATEPDLTLEAIVQRLLAGLGLKTSEAAIRRFFKRHAITFKKNAVRRRTGSARRIPGARKLEGKPSEP